MQVAIGCCWAGAFNRLILPWTFTDWCLDKLAASCTAAADLLQQTCEVQFQAIHQLADPAGAGVKGMQAEGGAVSGQAGAEVGRGTRAAAAAGGAGAVQRASGAVRFRAAAAEFDVEMGAAAPAAAEQGIPDARRAEGAGACYEQQLTPAAEEASKATAAEAASISPPISSGSGSNTTTTSSSSRHNPPNDRKQQLSSLRKLLQSKVVEPLVAVRSFLTLEVYLWGHKGPNMVPKPVVSLLKELLLLTDSLASLLMTVEAWPRDSSYAVLAAEDGSGSSSTAVHRSQVGEGTTVDGCTAVQCGEEVQKALLEERSSSSLKEGVQTGMGKGEGVLLSGSLSGRAGGGRSTTKATSGSLTADGRLDSTVHPSVSGLQYLVQGLMAPLQEAQRTLVEGIVCLSSAVAAHLRAPTVEGKQQVQQQLAWVVDQREGCSRVLVKLRRQLYEDVSQQQQRQQHRRHWEKEGVKKQQERRNNQLQPAKQQETKQQQQQQQQRNHHQDKLELKQEQERTREKQPQLISQQGKGQQKEGQREKQRLKQQQECREEQPQLVVQQQEEGQKRRQGEEEGHEEQQHGQQCVGDSCRSLVQQQQKRPEQQGMAGRETEVIDFERASHRVLPTRAEQDGAVSSSSAGGGSLGALGSMIGGGWWRDAGRHYMQQMAMQYALDRVVHCMVRVAKLATALPQGQKGRTP